MKFLQVSMTDDAIAWGITTGNQLVQSLSLHYFLGPYAKEMAATAITFGDNLLARSAHALNDHNPIILEKQHEKFGTSHFRLQTRSFRIYSCSAPPCNDKQGQLNTVLQMVFLFFQHRKGFASTEQIVQKVICSRKSSVEAS
jgi:hypothetical protein